MAAGGNGRTRPITVTPQRKFQVGDKVGFTPGCLMVLTERDLAKYAGAGESYMGYITEMRHSGLPYCLRVSGTPDAETGFFFRYEDLELLEPVEERERERVKEEAGERAAEPANTTEISQEQQNPLTAKEQKARAILAWYLAEYLLKPKEGNIYPLVNRHAKEPANENEYETLFTERTTDNVRIAMKELALYLYQLLTGHSERTDPSFLLEYPPLKRYSPDVSDFLTTTIHQMIEGKFRNPLVLKETLEREPEQELKHDEVAVVTIQYIIDCDARPLEPSGLTVAPESDQLPNRVRGQFTFDSAQVNLHLLPNQKGDRRMVGNDVRRGLANKPVLPANVLDFLLANPHLIPEEWKGKYVFFWGTIYRDLYGNLCVRYLCGGGRWYSSCHFIGSDWIDVGPAALRAS